MKTLQNSLSKTIFRYANKKTFLQQCTYQIRIKN